jgi:tRNA/rRNA methyltransferase
MNLGQAVAVCLYELVRDAKAEAQPGKPKLATASEVERITGILLDALHDSGYLNRRVVNDSENRIRRLVRRLNLPAGDTDAWLGMLRQIVWKLRSEKDRRV